MNTKLPDPINAGKKPEKPGIYVCVVGTKHGALDGSGRQHAAACKWDGKVWAVWTEAFDPPEWDPVEFQNCYVVSWVTTDQAMRAALREANAEAEGGRG